MKINHKVEEEINKQINREFSAAYFYLSMSAYFESLNLKGFAHWARAQANEEREHAMKFYNYILDRSGMVKLAGIGQPRTEWGSPLAAFENALENEQNVTQHINQLDAVAITENDKATQVFLQWFINEQVEEESSMNNIIQKLKLIGDSGSGLFIMDKELGKME